MKSYCLLIIFGISFSIYCSEAVGLNYSDTIKIHYLSINISELVFRDVRVMYEWPHNNKYYLKAGLGFKPGIRKNTYTTDQFLSENTMYIFPAEITATEWYYIHLGINKAVKKLLYNNVGNLYISADLLLRYNYHAPKYDVFWVGLEEKSETKFISLKKMTTGLILTAGEKKLFQLSSNRYRFFFDFYAGVGLRYAYGERINYAYGQGYVMIDNLQTIDPPEVSVINAIVPTVHLGLRTGIAFK